MVQNTHGLLIMLLSLTTLRSSRKRTTGVERHWSHGTWQKLLGQTVIRARSKTIPHSLKETLIFLAFLTYSF